MENCMIDPPAEAWYPGCEDEDEYPYHELTPNLMSLFDSDPGVCEARA